MCFASSVLQQVPWTGDSITEDIDQTLRLVRAGVCIRFEPDAVVRAQMPATGRQAATQRERWEGGRYRMLGRALALFARSLVTLQLRLADRALELIVPPFAELFAVPAVALAIGFVWQRAASDAAGAHPWVAAWAAVLAGELLYLAAGMVIARVPLGVASSLICAPFYVVWKLGLYGAMVARGGPSGWRRTERV